MNLTSKFKRGLVVLTAVGVMGSFSVSGYVQSFLHDFNYAVHVEKTLALQIGTKQRVLMEQWLKNEKKYSESLLNFIPGIYYLRERFFNPFPKLKSSEPKEKYHPKLLDTLVA